MSFYTDEELVEMGFQSLGPRVKISRKASFHNPARIAIGAETRIDDFCVLSAGEGGIRIGDHVHVAVYTSLIGRATITLSDFANLSSRVAIYSSNDDYSGSWMTNPTVPERFTNVTSAPVRIGRHVIVGCGSVVLPGVTMHDGSGAGALALINSDCEPFGMYLGCPAIKKGQRSREMLAHETALRKNAHCDLNPCKG